jgi:hypothetical protein
MVEVIHEGTSQSVPIMLPTGLSVLLGAFSIIPLFSLRPFHFQQFGGMIREMPKVPI